MTRFLPTLLSPILGLIGLVLVFLLNHGLAEEVARYQNMPQIQLGNLTFRSIQLVITFLALAGFVLGVFWYRRQRPISMTGLVLCGTALLVAFLPLWVFWL